MEVILLPRKPKKPCRYPGCARLVEADESYCLEHKRLAAQQYERYGRPEENKKRYGYRWRKIRALFLAAHPLCEMCRKAGRFTEATEVHHILPLAHGGTHDEENLMALCKACHSRISAESGDRWRNKKPRKDD